ncbi:MAG TPA: hypothetical protein VME19_21555 [Streptosporangiaceae bacterium]|nr:hypothetical protein [Streptosporangiaceae bacterium]
MNFCTACGCERTGVNHYCDGCGAEFGESSRLQEPDLLGDAPLRAGRHELQTAPDSWAGGWAAAPWPDRDTESQPASVSVTRPDLGIGLLDSLLVPPPAPAWEGWYDYPAADDGTRGQPSSGWRRRIVIAMVAVVVVAAAGGAAAYELRHGHGRPGPPAADGSGAAARPTTTHAGASAPPGAAGGGLAVEAAPSVAGNPALPQVMTLLRRYFSAINSHDYAAYSSLLSPQLLEQSTAAAFDSGDGSTADSGATLTGISATDAGGVAAAVTFTSHQEPADSPDNSACDNWSITLYLVPDGAGYLIGPPPPGYRATYVAC